MSLAIQDFWKLVIDSQLLSPDECQRLAASFGQIKGADHGNSKLLAEWLVDQRVLSRYHTKVLLARRAGPFVFGDYKVQDRVESGRLAGMFRAIHLPTRQPVSLCFLAGPALQDPQSVPRLQQQLQGVLVSSHPHVARAYELVDLGSYKFIVFADLQGKSLEEVLAEKPRLSYLEACRMGRQIALGLAHLHTLGQVHGEVRPENIWMEQSGNVRLLHAPLWRNPLSGPTLATHATAQPTEEQLLAADYQAPELAGGAWPDARTDVYSLGCTLFHALAGRAPASGGDLVQKLRRHASENFHALHLINPQVPEPVAQVVGYMLAKDPAARYQQAMHVAEALAVYLDAASLAPPVEPATPMSQAYEAWLRSRGASAQAAMFPGAVPGVLPAGLPQPFAATPVPAGLAQPAPISQPMAMPYAGMPQSLPTPQAQAGVVNVPVPMTPAATAPQPVASGAMSPSPLSPSPQAPVVSVARPGASSSAATSLAAQRLAAKKAERRNQLIVGGSIGLLAVVVVAIVLANRNDAPSTAGNASPANTTNPVSSNTVSSNAGNSSTTPGATNTTTTNGATTKPVENASAINGDASTQPAGEPLASIDSDPIWESPTSGKPLDLAYLPSGVQLIVALRPAAMLAHPEWQRIVETGGEPAAQLLDRLHKLSGVQPEKIEQAIVGFLDGGGGRPPLVALVVRTSEPVDEGTLQQTWGNPSAAKIGGKELFNGQSHCYYVPEEGQGRVIAAAPLAYNEEIGPWLERGASPPALRRELEVLARASDVDRHMTILFAPNFLFTGGKDLFSGPFARLKEPIQSFLSSDSGELPHAGSLSFHVDDNLFAELRILGTTDQVVPTELARQYRERVQAWRQAFKSYLLSLNVSPYSKEILFQIPDWLEYVGEYTRAATSDKQAVLRMYLPSVAAHNLAFGTQLALVEVPGAAVATAGPTQSAPKPLAERLKEKYTLAFDRDSLERTLDALSKDTNIPITIMGKDLELEGITKNQSFGLDERGKPIGEILQVIMKKANPDGKLIYVIKKEGDKEVLVVTTRAAAANRGDTIPPEFKQ